MTSTVKIAQEHSIRNLKVTHHVIAYISSYLFFWFSGITLQISGGNGGVCLRLPVQARQTGAYTHRQASMRRPRQKRRSLRNEAS